MENKAVNSIKLDSLEWHPWCYLHFGKDELASFLNDEHAQMHWLMCNCLESEVIPSALVYFIEIKSLDKTQLNTLVDLYKHHKDAHLYIFAPKDLLQSSLCRYALHVKAKTLNGIPMEKKHLIA